MLDSEIAGLSERPINFFLPRFLQVTFCTSTNYPCPLPLLIYSVISSVHLVAELVAMIFLSYLAAFPVSTCYIKEALLEFSESIHYANANSEFNWNNYDFFFLHFIFELILVFVNQFNNSWGTILTFSRFYLCLWINICKVYLYLLMIQLQRCGSW